MTELVGLRIFYNKSYVQFKLCANYFFYEVHTKEIMLRALSTFCAQNLCNFLDQLFHPTEKVKAQKNSIKKLLIEESMPYCCAC